MATFANTSSTVNNSDTVIHTNTSGVSQFIWISAKSSRHEPVFMYQLAVAGTLINGLKLLEELQTSNETPFIFLSLDNGQSVKGIVRHGAVELDIIVLTT